MARKRIQGTIRDKEKTKEKLLSAVGEILKNSGFTGLNASKIAKAADVDRKLIYEYFGSPDELITTYIKSQDYWDNASKNTEDLILENKSDNGKTLTKEFLKGQLKTMINNGELQKIITWELSEPHPLLKKLAEQREEQGELLFANLTDSYFKENAETFRAIQALLISGIYYLSIHNSVNGSKFCGIDLNTEEGEKTFEKALDLVVDLVYEKQS
ncbi:TetR/AcrR family transcriptional regulator [uncultured Chryseobacterium sp.]|uniref:TetR/AcrR family transcriptional regulator n=1 Tax=uncultured Chryseobacterium sp. TaxID=259322 RepID=UPI002633458B|nr:TetR/AcrR family transcriptional regulator [uncultured Chryseobacterium sp.]